MYFNGKSYTLPAEDVRSHVRSAIYLIYYNGKEGGLKEIDVTYKSN